MKTIFFAPYRNVSIRYILSTDIFKYLRDKNDLRIIVFLKNNDIDYYEKKYGSENIIFEDILYNQSISIIKSHIGSFFILIRTYMYGKKGKLENNSPKVWGAIYEKQFSESGIRGKIFSSLAKLIAALGSQFSYLRKFVVYLESILFKGSIYDHYFVHYEPKQLVISSTGYMIDPLIMRAAKRNNCKVLSLVHSWDNPTTKAYGGVSPDNVVAWNEIMKEELSVFHDIKKENIHVGGIAHWDDYFNGSLKNGGPFFKKEANNTTRKFIMYATSSPIMFKTTFDIIEDILIKIKNGIIVNKPKLIVRLHPNYLAKQKSNKRLILDVYKGKIDELQNKYVGLVEFNMPIVNWIKDDYELPIEDVKNLGKLLMKSDLLLTEYSTLMIEGSIFDTPVINVALGNFRNTDQPISVIEDLNHIQRVLKTKATRQAYNMDQLIDQINQYLSNPQLDSENRKKLVEQEITTNIGHAGEEIGKHIYSLLDN